MNRKNHIGLLNEKSLHSDIKYWYSQPGDRLEATVNNFVIDIRRDDLLIEIQTTNFSSISNKLRSLLKNFRVRLVYPIAREKWIKKYSENGELIHRRKSPKRGKLHDIFKELIRIPTLINHQNFSLEVLMITSEEIRWDDGKGSWRRKGVSIKDRKLLEVMESLMFTQRTDFLFALPDNLDSPFSNRSFANLTGISIYTVRKITYSLRKMGLIQQVGKRGNEKLFELVG